MLAFPMTMMMRIKPVYKEIMEKSYLARHSRALCLLRSSLFFISDFKLPPLAPALTLLLRCKMSKLLFLLRFIIMY